MSEKAQTKPPLNMEALGQAAECLRTLAHPVRIRMVQLLISGRYTVGEIAEDCGIAENLASEHLRLMQRCGFFTSEREGRRVYYQVAEPHLHDIMNCIEGRFLSDSGK
ncbi:ArsR family transcriptional regulator [Bremerella cremea]|uniref:ArsR family transcriptional regulator n=1 Tax=Blastopirellula marina TaxID=124 RepID=A0A2S8FW24_9BACT|nr:MULTISPECIES: metalloregulator ArsR/SmtB family transcription factor [Pirellulaceae]PQO36377.1 ArsR family transcriptional regulator [Blastopirellula marina]RCS49055.1 ArsR family transcriptional regulator [Bremerella cremea]